MDTEKNNPYKGGEHIEQKKSAGANIERKKTTGLLVGFVFVFALLYVALEYTTFEHHKVQKPIETAATNIDVPVLQNIRIIKPPKPQQPQKSAPKEIDDKIKLIDENSEEEESELVAPEDMGALDDFVDVDYTEVIEVEEEAEEEEIFMAVQVQASFPGGLKKMYEYLSDNIKYPAVSRNNGSQGTTVLRFVVQKDGRIVNIEVIKSSGDAFLDNEAIRVVGSMPKWTPAEQGGRKVACWFTLPVKFTLQ